MVLAKWGDYQSSGLGGLELVVQKYTDQKNRVQAKQNSCGRT